MVDPRNNKILYSYGAAHISFDGVAREDGFVVDPQRNLIVMANAFGGAERGDVLCKELLGNLAQHNGESLRDWKNFLKLEFERIFKKNELLPLSERAGLSLLFGIESVPGRIDLFNIGSNICYLFRGGAFSLLVFPQSYWSTHGYLRSSTLENVFNLVDFPLHAIGTEELAPENEVVYNSLPGDVLFFCTDGLKLNESSLLDLQQALSAEGALNGLHEIAKVFLQKEQELSLISREATVLLLGVR